MMRLAFALMLAAPLASGPAAAADTGAVKIVYLTTCADCHGRQGERRALGQSRQLRTLDAETVRETLRARRDLPALRTTQDRVKADLSDSEIEALTDYVATLASP